MRLIPWSSQQIDLPFIRRALTPGEPTAAAALRNVEVAPVAHQGNAGVVSRVVLQYGEARSGPASLVVKLPPEDRARREQASRAGWFESEVRFYRELAPDCPVRTPRCFLAEGEPSDLRWVLVLEDLGDPVGTWPEGRGLPREQARMMVDELAMLHAAFWNAPRLAAAPWLRTPVDNVPFWQGVIQSVARHLPDALAFEVPAGVLPLLETLHPRLPALAEHLASPPYTLAHGDFTQRNSSLGADGRPTAFDWQLVQRARAARDVAYLVPFLRPEVTRGSGLRELLERYHAGLVQHGVSGYSLGALERDQVLATTEVMQVGLATIAPSLAAAVAGGERTEAPWLRGLLGSIGDGATRLHLIEHLKAQFPV